MVEARCLVEEINLGMGRFLSVLGGQVSGPIHFLSFMLSIQISPFEANFDVLSWKPELPFLTFYRLQPVPCSLALS